MSDHLSDEQNAYNAAYIKGRRDMAAEFEAAERALVKRVEAVLNDPDTNVTGWSGDWSYGEVLELVAAIRAALAGDSSHSGTGGEG